MYPPWLQPMHADLGRIDPPLRDQMVDAGHDVPGVADAEVADVQLRNFSP